MGIISKLCSDPRPILLVSFSCGIAVWWLNPVWLCILFLCTLSIICFSVSTQQTECILKHNVFYYVLFFIGFWCLLKCVVEISSSSKTISQIVSETTLLALRLSVIITLGLCLIYKYTPRLIALSAAWYLRPFFKQHTWEVALALSLMIKTIPRLLYTITQIHTVTQYRLANSSYFRKIHIVISATIRLLILHTTNQTTAIATRQIATPTSWEMTSSPHPYMMIGAIIISSFLLWLSISNTYSI